MQLPPFLQRHRHVWCAEPSSRETLRSVHYRCLSRWWRFVTDRVTFSEFAISTARASNRSYGHRLTDSRRKVSISKVNSSLHVPIHHAKWRRLVWLKMFYQTTNVIKLTSPWNTVSHIKLTSTLHNKLHSASTILFLTASEAGTVIPRLTSDPANEFFG